jgi:hypothetical protein
VCSSAINLPSSAIKIRSSSIASPSAIAKKDGRSRTKIYQHCPKSHINQVSRVYGIQAACTCIVGALGMSAATLNILLCELTSSSTVRRNIVVTMSFAGVFVGACAIVLFNMAVAVLTYISALIVYVLSFIDVRSD